MTKIIGKTLLDQFRVEDFIASGGMGVVYRVWDLKRNVPLAMKVLHADLAEEPAIFKRFRREARALRKLAHPNIVPFYGLHQTLDFAFLLERYIDGPTLKQILRRREGKPLDLDEVLVYLKALSSALGYAHAHGVVHCDVKPGNVMVDQGGSVYLTDFGVARHAESTTTTLGFAGTATYTAPEQCRGEAVTAQTDVYALGIILYEMLTGRRPFRGDEKETEQGGSTSAERVRYAHLHLQPPDPQQVNPSLSRSLVEVIQKALAKEHDQRYSSVRKLYEAACHAAGMDPASVPDRVTLPKELVSEWIVPARNGEQLTEPERAQDIAPTVSVERLLQIIRQVLSTTTGKLMMGAIILLAIVVGYNLFNTNKGVDGSNGESDQARVTSSPTEVWVAVIGSATPSPTITASPTVTTTPTPSPRIYDFHACLDVCLESGANATRVFPEKQRKIFVQWRYENIPVGAHYVRKWTMDGREWVRYECPWPGPESGLEEKVTLTEPDGLHSGEWEISISIDGVVLLQEQIWIEGDWDYWYPAGYFDTCYGKR
ncbi:MAG: protein kinase [Anaerolineales bacterium]|nr:protein kinase [Anaerolineales bacterium]